MERPMVYRPNGHYDGSGATVGYESWTKGGLNSMGVRKPGRYWRSINCRLAGLAPGDMEGRDGIVSGEGHGGIECPGPVR